MLIPSSASERLDTAEVTPVKWDGAWLALRVGVRSEGCYPVVCVCQYLANDRWQGCVITKMCEQIGSDRLVLLFIFQIRKFCGTFKFHVCNPIHHQIPVTKSRACIILHIRKLKFRIETLFPESNLSPVLLFATQCCSVRGRWQGGVLVQGQLFNCTSVHSTAS